MATFYGVENKEVVRIKVKVSLKISLAMSQSQNSSLASAVWILTAVLWHASTVKPISLPES